MKVMLVNGSPHRNGCTATALRYVAKELEANGIETTEFWVGAKPIRGCMDCGRCQELKRCAFEDDTVNEAREIAAGCDGFIFGTPVHYAGTSGQIKSFMDRLFFSDLWGRCDTFTMKPAAGIMTARRAGALPAFDQVNKYFAHHEMPIVSSTYWNLAYGMKPEQIDADLEGVHTFQVLAQNMAYLLKCFEAGRKLGIEHPRLGQKHLDVSVGDANNTH